MGAIGKHLVLQGGTEPDCDVYPYLPKAKVEKTSAAACMCPIAEDAA